MGKRMRRILLGVGVALGTVLLSACVSVITISSDEVGLRFDRLSGEVSGPLEPGTYIATTLDQIIVYPLTEQTLLAVGDPGMGGDAVTALTGDGQEVQLDVTLHYSLNAADVLSLHYNWADTYADDLLRPVVRGVTRDLVATVDAVDLYADSGAGLLGALQTELDNRLQREGITVEAVEITGVRFSPFFTQAMQDRATAEVRVTEAMATAAALRLTAEADAATLRATIMMQSTQTAIATPKP